MSLFDLTGKIAVVTGLVARNRQGDRAAARRARRARRSSRRARSRRAKPSVKEIEAAARPREGGRDRRVDLVEARSRAADQGDPRQARPHRHPRLQCGVEPVLRPRSAASRTSSSARSSTTTSSRTIGSCSSVAPGMIELKDGSIIIVSSIGGLIGSPVIGAYNISKAADMQLARNLDVGARQARHPRQLHRAGADQDRLRQGAVGQPGAAEGDRSPDTSCDASAIPTTSRVRPCSWAADAGRFMTGQTMVGRRRASRSPALCWGSSPVTASVQNHSAFMSSVVRSSARSASSCG